MKENPNEVKIKTSIPLFVSLLPLLYYVDYAKKLYRYFGFPRPNEFSFESFLFIFEPHNLPLSIWFSSVLYPGIYFGYAVLLYKYAPRIENAINEPFKKNLPLIFPIILTVIIFANVAIFGGNSNSMIKTKLGWCWAIGIIFFAAKFIDLKKLASNNNDSQS